MKLPIRQKSIRQLCKCKLATNTVEYTDKRIAYWTADGTFKIINFPFTQLFSLHGLKKEWAVKAGSTLIKRTLKLTDSVNKKLFELWNSYPEQINGKKLLKAVSEVYAESNVLNEAMCTV